MYELILKNITILDHSILPEKDFKKALKLCQNVDDTVFVGFSEYLKAKLWTGDKQLNKGLEKKGFKRVITTTELYEDFTDRSRIGE
ncbi:hypothetical protein G3O08_17180 [Cryomorpha ignava]|uniref:PIN domain-containing protein n=1 Tax=Cryomorpha ignava TaxID=101383 RepID=A0A7K3WWC7_9FLAO|nr:hypothetical protein [Cryomorpha ignava]